MKKCPYCAGNVQGGERICPNCQKAIPIWNKKFWSTLIGLSIGWLFLVMGCNWILWSSLKFLILIGDAALPLFYADLGDLVIVGGIVLGLLGLVVGIVGRIFSK